MHIKFLIVSLLILLSNFIACESDTEKRKIKLSDESVGSKVDQQFTSTIHLEPKERRSIAVMFFQNLTGDNNLQWLQKGLTEMFIRALSQSHYVSVLSSERLFEILERLDKTALPEEIDLDMAAIVAKEANVEALLQGNITKSGNTLKINVKIHEPKQGRIIKEESVEGPGLEKIFGMVDQLTQKIKNDLRLSLEKAESSRGIAELSTKSLEAWRYYMAGIDLMNKLLHADAIPQFEKAIELDSAFVSAHLRLCIACLGSGKNEQAYKIYQKLQSLIDKATQQERYQIDILGTNFTYDLQKAIAVTQQWLQQYPDDRDANLNIANFYFNLHNYDQAHDYYQRVLTIDPKYYLAYNQLGYISAYNGDFSSAISILNKYKELVHDEPNPYDSLGEIYLYLGDYEQAEKYFKQAIEVNENFTHSWVHLANLHLDKGDYDQALKFCKTYLEKVPTGILKSSAYSQIALTYWRLGEKDNAIAHYQKSLENYYFQSCAVELINEIYLEKSDSANASKILKQHYDRLQKSSKQELTKFDYLFSLISLSLRYSINISETIDILKEAIESSDNEAIKMRTKFFLVLLLAKINQQDQIKKLWREFPPSKFVKHIEEIRSIGYTGFWKYFAMLNPSYHPFINEAIKNYEELIKYSVESNLKMLEVAFRLLLADLYLCLGDQKKVEQQLRFVGMPSEETWMICGPFDNKNGFHQKYFPEEEIILNKVYKQDSQDIIWRHAGDQMRDGYINLKQIYEKSNWSVAYGLLYLTSSDSREVQFRIGTDEAVKVWLNDEEIWKFNVVRSAIIDDNIIHATLKRGTNKILIKVCNRIADWGFYFRVADEQGNGMPDIQFVSPDIQPELL